MQKLSRQVAEDPWVFTAFGFGTGLLPYAPGTWGTLAAIPLYLILSPLPVLWYLLLVTLLFLAGIYLCQNAVHVTGVEDHPGIVWDEIVGYLFTMTAIPLQIHWILLSFVLFRIFDIWKPQPIRFFDKVVKGGLGIMLDDLIAAFFAWLIMQSLVWIFSP